MSPLGFAENFPKHVFLHRQRAGSQFGMTRMCVGLLLDPGAGTHLYQMHFAGERNDSPRRLEMRTSVPHRPHSLLIHEPPPRRHCAEPGLPFPVGGVSIGSSADPPPTAGHHSWLQWRLAPLLLVGMLQPRMLGLPSWGDGKAGDSLQNPSLFLLLPNW